MRLLFSEAAPDYSRYLYPYVIWGIPEPGESPADCFARGFLLSSPDLDRFVLGRSVRVDLQRYVASSENRRILRKGEGIAVELVERRAFDYSAERRTAWIRFADLRFGEGVMSFDRLDRLMQAPAVTHLLVFRQTTDGTELGAVLLYLEEPRAACYYYAFYNLDARPLNLGMFMMTRAVGLFAACGVRHLYLGSCYSEQALYKTQFAGIEFFNGHAWSSRLDELKYLLNRSNAGGAAHLLQDHQYLERFHGGSLDPILVDARRCESPGIPLT